ncbi:hypothetical protein, variant [Verruconis gallopava]|uniref:RING-type domain-containing protein n=1 Tax=Verruconis gallopava TaxID=253628 RepID=A0A0D2AIK0_9PEZI|nr:uncharacterized protein PV09_09484 [Verruconis gallopava]XP_016208624.1 hypothetical protein, variant [Verruconis gallopava]KIV98753.1 hypothetical protein PV09_09484 [Verruconis gallopava]KIV98754.1 hypothetical protein, variant [Verruconis gallopava]
MATSITEAKIATKSLLQKVEPHMNDALALESLGFFLPVALKALDTIGLFKVEESPRALSEYKSTCDKLVEAIQSNEGSLGQRAWKDVTVDGKSWHDHLVTMKSCISTLQAEVNKIKVERPFLAEAILAAVELKRRIQSSEGSSPHFDILDGTLLFLLSALDLLQSLPRQNSDSVADLAGPLRQCSLKCRSALPSSEEAVVWMESCQQLLVLLQGFSNTFVCFFLQKNMSDDAKLRALSIFSTMGTYYMQRNQGLLQRRVDDMLDANRAQPASKSAIQALPRTTKSVREICVICTESMEITTMPCGHCYHDGCLSHWLKVADSCPQCRETLKEERKADTEGWVEATE